MCVINWNCKRTAQIFYEMEEIMSIGTRIKALRMKKGLSQTEVAEVFHVSAQAVSKWESEASSPDISQLPVIASYFGITIDELFDYPMDLEYERIEKMIENGKALQNELFEHYEDFLLKEIKKNPKNHRAKSTLADLYHFHACRLNDKAVHYALDALELKPDNKFDLNTLTNASYGHANDWNIGTHYRLIEHYQKLIRNHSENQRTKLYLLDNLIADCRFDEATTVLNESNLELDAFYRMWIKEKQEGFDNVVNDYQKLIQEYCNDWRMLMETANRYAYNRRYEEAIDIYEKTFEAAPKPRVTDMLASIRCLHKCMGNYRQAMTACQRELELLKDEWNITKGDLVDELNQEIRTLKTKCINNS